MMKHYDDLTEKEKEPLLKFPAYISLLTSTSKDGIDKEEKDTAIKITHVKTFSGDPMILGFYKDADARFEKTITEMNKTLPPGHEERQAAIKRELDSLEPLLHKLDPVFVNTLRRSMKSYVYYLKKAHENVFEYFVFPMPLEGISD